LFGKKDNNLIKKTNKKTVGTGGAAKGAGTGGAAKGATGLGSSLVSAGLALAGIALAAGAIYAGVKIWNKDADKLKETQEDLEAATKRAEESQNRYQTMKDNISNYEDAKKGIEELTKGTLEFDEAVAEANQKALKLLETYKNLSYEVDENGIIQINEDSLKAAQAAEFRRMQAGQME
jgi:uncharacterized protein HemX